MLKAAIATLFVFLSVSSARAQSICTTFNENCAVIRARVARGDASRFASDLQRALTKMGGGNPKMDSALFVKQWDFIVAQAKKQGLPSIDVYAAAQPRLGVTPRGLRIYMFGVQSDRIVKSDMYHEFLIAAPTGLEPKPVIPKCDCSSQACSNLMKITTLKGTIVKQTGSLMLELDKPICFKGDHDMDDPPNAIDVPNQVVLHIAPIRMQYSSVAAFVGKHVAATGQPFGRDNAHHLTPVLLDPYSIKAD